MPLYGKHIRCLIKRAGWTVTCLCYMLIIKFEQDCFKRDFVIMNEVSRQNTQSTVEKDFYELMTNSNSLMIVKTI